MRKHAKGASSGKPFEFVELSQISRSPANHKLRKSVDARNTGQRSRARTVSRERSSPERDRERARSVDKGTFLPDMYPQKGKIQYFKELEDLKATIHVVEEQNRQLKTKILNQLVFTAYAGQSEEIQGMCARLREGDAHRQQRRSPLHHGSMDFFKR